VAAAAAPAAGISHEQSRRRLSLVAASSTKPCAQHLRPPAASRLEPQSTPRPSDRPPPAWPAANDAACGRCHRARRHRRRPGVNCVAALIIEATARHSWRRVDQRTKAAAAAAATTTTRAAADWLTDNHCNYDGESSPRGLLACQAPVSQVAATDSSTKHLYSTAAADSRRRRFSNVDCAHSNSCLFVAIDSRLTNYGHDDCSVVAAGPRGRIYKHEKKSSAVASLSSYEIVHCNWQIRVCIAVASTGRMQVH